MAWNVINDGQAVVITKDIEASSNDVFDAFTHADKMAMWMWGASAGDTGAESSATVGGHYIVWMARPKDAPEWPGWGDRYAVTGVFGELIRPTRLVYTVRWHADVGYNHGSVPPQDEIVTVTIDPTDTGCTITMIHAGLPADDVSANEHGRSIDSTLDDLAALLE
jgi:uncharacterized protein YndB with AHSA1/START domain